MQLGGLRHTIRHTAATRLLTSDAGRDDEDSTFGVGVEGLHGFAHEVGLGFDVDGKACVPVLGGGCVEVTELGEARVACVGDENVDSTKFGDGFLDGAGAVCFFAHVLDTKLATRIYPW